MDKKNIETKTETEKPKLKFIPENRSILLTEEKLKVLNHKAKWTIWLGGKDAGKTFPVQVQQLWDLQQNDYNSALTMKLFKTQAADSINRNMLNLVDEAKEEGFNPSRYQGSGSKTYKYINRNKITENQGIHYLSYDNPNSHTNMGFFNNGIVKTVHLEEMVDPLCKNVPAEKDFWFNMGVMDKNIIRVNRKSHLKFGRKLEPINYHFTLNAWDENHPLISFAEKHYPQAEFIEFVLGQPLETINIDSDWDAIWESIKTNHTGARYDEQTDRLVVRLTSFANPTYEIPEKEREEVKQALIDGDTFVLSAVLGLTKDNKNGSPTYDLSNYAEANFEEFKDYGWKAVSASLGLDVDINLGLYAYTTYLMKKGKKYLVFVDKGNLRSCWGSGKNGRNLTQYVEFTKEIIQEEQDKIIKRVEGEPELPYMLWIDEDKGWFMNVLDKHPMIFDMAKAKKHGPWDIKKRETWLNIAIGEYKIYFHPENGDLKKKLSMSSLTKSLKQRDENGGLAKHYNRINACEYSIFPFKNLVFE